MSARRQRQMCIRDRSKGFPPGTTLVTLPTATALTTAAATTPKPKSSTAFLSSGCKDAVSNCQQYGRISALSRPTLPGPKKTVLATAFFGHNVPSAQKATVTATSTTPEPKPSSDVITSATTPDQNQLLLHLLAARML